MSLQLSLISLVLSKKKTKEIEVLSYLVRNSTSGMYVIKRNYRLDIAKSIKSTKTSVRDILTNLRKKKLIRFVSNEQGNNLGCYVFHPAIESLCEERKSLTFDFVTT